MLKLIRFIKEANFSTLSGSLCFFLIMNGGAYIFLFASITGYFINYSELINRLNINTDVKNLLIYLFSNASNMRVNIFLIIFSIYSSSSLYYHFLSVCQILLDRKIDYKFNKRISSIIISLLLMLIISSSIIILSFLPLFFSNRLIYSYIIFILFIILFIYIANVIALQSFSFKKLKKGFLFSFLYVIVFSIGFVIFITLFSNFKAIYGCFSALIIFLFYLYMIINGILIGIRLNWKNIEE